MISPYIKGFQNAKYANEVWSPMNASPISSLSLSERLPLETVNKERTKRGLGVVSEAEYAEHSMAYDRMRARIRSPAVEGYCCMVVEAWEFLEQLCGGSIKPEGWLAVSDEEGYWPED